MRKRIVVVRKTKAQQFLSKMDTMTVADCLADKELLGELAWASGSQGAGLHPSLDDSYKFDFLIFSYIGCRDAGRTEDAIRALIYMTSCPLKATSRKALFDKALAVAAASENADANLWKVHLDCGLDHERHGDLKKAEQHFHKAEKYWDRDPSAESSGYSHPKDYLDDMLANSGKAVRA